MTRVDFYIVDSTAAAARERLACRLAEKAWRLAHRIYIHGRDPRHVESLDQLLWTFRDGSFVPHEPLAEPVPDCPILIGHGEAPESHTGVLINLSETVPTFFSRFERVVEIVNQDEPVRQAGRERFKYYRDRGYDLHTHNVSG